MGYIKSRESISTTSITVCIMERHQAGQEEKLMKVVVKPDSFEDPQRPRGSPADHRGCLKCAVALAAVMGLVIGALVTVVILHRTSSYMIEPSHNQTACLLEPAKRISTTYNLTESDEPGRYDIFTVNISATYLIYGWVKFSDGTGKDVFLKQLMDQSDPVILQKKSMSKMVFFFFDKALVANGSRISIFFESAHTDSVFHLYKL